MLCPGACPGIPAVLPGKAGGDLVHILACAVPAPGLFHSRSAAPAVQRGGQRIAQKGRRWDERPVLCGGAPCPGGRHSVGTQPGSFHLSGVSDGGRMSVWAGLCRPSKREITRKKRKDRADGAVLLYAKPFSPKPWGSDWRDSPDPGRGG